MKGTCDLLATKDELKGNSSSSSSSSLLKDSLSAETPDAKGSEDPPAGGSEKIKSDPAKYPYT